MHEVDAGRLSEWALKLSGAPGGVGKAPDTLVQALVILAVAATLQEHPTLNAQYDQGRREISYHAQEHITFATHGDHRTGLLPFAGTLTVAQAASHIAAIRTQPDCPEPSTALPEPTFTVVNIGAVGALFESPIIVQPQIAILALGAVTKRLVVRADPSGLETTVVRPMMYLSLTYDHRLVDGADAGRFLQALIGRLTSTAFYTSLP
ncbi:pyruvate/2-oxoglutarate dehydrogenase complex dihydrolipoamide acyltransferase (E2) component [Arthrobacter agilis]|nr:pyruvate/2-oxoglutarate dehydrogenase complex dihydrolipoamide acyltransferase (E2) component [Arthrobacter agilis]